MKLGQYLAAMGLSVLLALPVVAQTTAAQIAESPGGHHAETTRSGDAERDRQANRQIRAGG
jgi:hypothetical protein